jgi:transposase-like protein
MTGRPTKLTPEVKERIVRAIRAGNYGEVAARAAGISRSTYYRWMERGREGEAIYCDFADAVSGAEADAEVEAVARIRQAMPDDWRACAHYLERRHPDRWRRRETREHTGEGGGPIRITDLIMSDPERRKEFREILRRTNDLGADEPGGPGTGD